VIMLATTTLVGCGTAGQPPAHMLEVARSADPVLVPALTFELGPRIWLPSALAKKA